MKTTLLFLSVFLSVSLFGQIIYVDNFDGVYPFTTSDVSYEFDLNGDSQDDVRLYFGTWANNCFNGTNSGPSVRFKFLGQNLVNGSGSQSLGIDCANDTLDIMDTWNSESMIFVGYMPWNGYCFNMGVGSHKQGVRMVLTNPANGGLGYKYGYIDYTVTTNGDIIIHGWYYEDTFNVPIVANTELDYPYDGNCIYYDTVTVYDTITTLTSVTDTLIINTSLGLPEPNNENTLLIYPNPANDYITIDNGDYLLMSNYSIKIENSQGQEVFQSVINQPQFYIDLNTWTGYGIYFVYLLDSQSNITTIRKIIIQ